ncbi:MAG: thermonuclease family protein [Kouleothrix sp.]|nr:thermonuclease family protein [Kouleothrix sp.]
MSSALGARPRPRRTSLLDGQTVAVEADASQGDRDRYDRLLRYLWLPDGPMVNQELLAQGYTFEYTAAPAPAASCDPPYPDACIPPAPPDLECADVPYRRFGVLAPDPHRFDRDRDGIGCE